MVKKQTDKMKWEKILKAEDEIKSKMRNKADYTKLLREYPVEPIDNPLATTPSRRILTGTALDRILSRRGGIEAGSTVEMYGEFACHSEDTQVLTPDGIKNWDDVSIGDYIYGKDEGGYIVKTRVDDVLIYDYDDELYQFDNNRYSLLVTPNHDIFYSPNKNARFLKKRADETYKRKSGYILSSFDWKGIDKPTFNIHNYIELDNSKLVYPQKSHRKPNMKELNTQLFMKLVGLYIAEGSPFKTDRGTYSQIRNSTYVNEISELLNELSLDYSIYEDSKFVIFHQDVAEYLLRCGEGASNKQIPQELMELDKEYLEELFDGLMMRDGHHNGFTYYTTSIKLRDQFLVLCLKLGYNPSYRPKEKSGRINYIDDREVISNYNYYYINIAYKPSGYFDPRQQIKSKIPYRGKVWCYSTDTANFFTVRNGQPTISGNTGKTQIAECIVAEAEGLKIYIDAEWTFRGDRFAEICTARGIDPKESADRIRLYRPMNWIHQEAVVKQLPEFDSDGKFLDIGVVIVDSIMKHWADSRDWQGRENLPQRQALLRAQISDLSNYCRRHNAVLFYTNQVYIAPVANPYASVENIYHSRGGASLEHIADYRILLRKGPRNLRFARLVDSPDLPLMEVPFVLHEKGISDIEDPGIRVQALERGEQYGLRFLDTKVSTRGAGKKYYAKAFLLGIMTEEEALENDYLDEKDIKELKEEKMEMKLERGEVKPPHEDDLTDEEKEALGEQKDDE